MHVDFPERKGETDKSVRMNNAILGPFKQYFRWMNDAILAPFNSVSVISRRCKGDNETSFRVEKISASSGLEPGAARCVDQRLIYWATGDPNSISVIWMDD